MSDHTWYEQTNRHNERELTIVNVALLVSKPPTKEKRVRVKVRMVLSGQSVTGAPDWISSAHSYVSQWHDQVSPNVEFRGYDLQFSADNLFGAEGVKSPKCQMRSFEITEFGPTEAPDIVANFTIYAPFSRALWEWLGAYGGDSCWCSFTPGLGEAGNATEDDGENDEDGDEDDTEDDEPEISVEDAVGPDDDEEPGKKSGPKNLIAFHEKQLDGEPKRGRGQPRKVDPLTINAATAF